MIELTLPWPARELSPNARVHWAVKSKHSKRYRQVCWAQAFPMRSRRPNAERLLFALEFVPPDRRKRDDDNLLSSCKALRDGVADALGVDDSVFVTQMSISKETTPGGAVRVRISEYQEAA